jgi:hypothetical protein
MGILRRFREWREDKNGVLTGPDIDADSVNTDELKTPLTGARLIKGSDQSINAGVRSEIQFGNAVNFNPNGPDFADIGNNAVKIPNDDYSQAKINFGIRLDAKYNISSVQPLVNGGLVEGLGRVFKDDQNSQMDTYAFGPIGISSGDSITIEVETASNALIDDSAFATYLSVVVR